MQKFFSFKNFKLFFYILFLYLLINLSFFIILLPDWSYKFFGDITIDQILFTLMLPLNGTPNSILYLFVRYLICPVIAYSTCVIFILMIITYLKYFNKLLLSNILNLVYKNSKILIISFIVLMALFMTINFFRPQTRHKFYNSTKNIIDSNSLIAHACGQIDGKDYTNSLESLLLAIRNGYKFIEMDLRITDDNKIVAIHDFNQFIRMTGNANLNNVFQDIIKQKIYTQYTPLTGEKINELFKKNKSLILVTDKISDFDILLNNFNFTDRMIVEVFSVKKYKEALKKGILYPALCVYTPDGLKSIMKEDIKMITTSIEFLKSNINVFKYFHKKGIVIMVYGTPKINDEQFLKDNLGVTCSLAYVDSVLPKDKNND